MDKTFAPSKVESDIYNFWEKNNFFEARVDLKKKPFCIILPLPNANGELHLGHTMFVYQDLMIRYYKMKGYETLWFPGIDHAGIETQFVFEKELEKKGESRFDYSKEELFKMIWEFTKKNKPKINMQMKKLGFALDWEKEKFTMDENVVKIIYRTFKKLYDAKFVYRDKKLVNYCIKDGTSFSDLEVKDVEMQGKLYFIKYPLVDSGFIEIATTRPETMLGDAAVCINPKDKRYGSLIGKTVILPIVKRKIPIIADDSVDIKFGTGAVKITPSHDFNDFEISKKHKLHHPPVIGFDGKIINTKTRYDGMETKQAREEIVKDLQNQGLLTNVKSHNIVVKACYRCGSTLEPLPLEQWFIKVQPLANNSINLIKTGKIKIIPKRSKKTLINILNNFIDWNISRQIVWGIKIPAWKCLDCNNWTITKGEDPQQCDKCKNIRLERDPDTFDTWFSSSQWPFATLESQGKDFLNYFYPTAVMETGYDILRAWVARMIMIGYFETKEPPFKIVYLHGIIRDSKGQKMSKSKGNVIDAIKKVSQYGADAWRASLVFGIKEGADPSFTDEKIIGMRNFMNKIWNIGRFLHMFNENDIGPYSKTASGHSRPASATFDVDRESDSRLRGNDKKQTENDAVLNELKKDFEKEKTKYFELMDDYKFSLAFDLVYDFLWHKYADFYIEKLKDELRNGNIKVKQLLYDVYFENLKFLHPFIPFVTDAVWKVFHGRNKTILSEKFN
jgi:valyl-tRNA synthetase